MKEQPIYVDRSRYLDGLNCPRLRALAYEAPNGAAPRGWAPVDSRHYHLVGNSLHEALEHVIQGGDPQEAANKIWAFTKDLSTIAWDRAELALPPDIAAREAATWVEAAMWTWIIERLPWIQREFTVEAVEQELEMPLGPINGHHPVIWLSRPDVILRRKSDRSLFVMDFKSSGFKEDAASSDLALQHKVLVYAQLAAVEHVYGEPVVGYLYEGFYKGQNREDKRMGFRRRYSPLAWAYCSPADGLTAASVDAENWRLGDARLLCDLPGRTIRDYVRKSLTSEQRQAQLMYSLEAIGANPMHVERWKKQVLANETKWQRWRSIGADLETVPQNDDHCMRYRGDPCPYLPACWDEAVRCDPVGSGKYQARVPNHRTEVSNGK